LHLEEAREEEPQEARDSCIEARAFSTLYLQEAREEGLQEAREEGLQEAREEEGRH
jgi:hypothetical protein